MSVHNLADERARRRPVYDPELIFDSEYDALTFAAAQVNAAREQADTAELTATLDRAAACIAACLNLHHPLQGDAR